VIKVWPHIGAAVTASLAHEQRLKVGKPNVVRPTIGADLDMMGEFVVTAVDEQVAKAGRAHFAERDLWATGSENGHAPLSCGIDRS
jgi:hypothetical protein